MYVKSSITLGPEALFTTLQFLRNLQINSIS
jgi:hypothetical protein